MQEASISIALCTFNGGRYLDNLLDSLLMQTTLPRELVICDDCSTDSTIEILNKFKSRAPFNVKIILNKERLGVIHNFEKALSLCKGDYIAPCDQDDVWSPEKLDTLITLLKQMEMKPGHGPYFAHTDIDLVDSQLKKMGISFLEHQGLKPLDQRQYRTLLVQNYIPGCSALFTRDLLEHALPIPEAAVMHDWWLALIASIAGKIHYDPSRTVLYRQHADNHLGSVSRFSMETLRKIIAIKPALRVIEKNFTASARQALAASARLSSNNVTIPDDVTGYTDSLAHSKLRSLGSVITGKVGRANFLRNMTLLAALLLYDKKSLTNTTARTVSPNS